MSKQGSLAGTVSAGFYALAVAASLFPLVQDGSIGHSNGIMFVIAMIITSPVSLLLGLLSDALLEINAYHLTGWPYYLTLAELFAGGLVNGFLIYWLVSWIARLLRRARA